MRRILVTGAGGSAAANFVHSLRLASEPSAVEPDYLDALNALIESEEVELVHPQPAGTVAGSAT